ncbi:hypothetical protein FE257_009521 [Aspergillus nanangensis]|uniref:Six-hairpin glycosidase-like protein n=1 Tax=Aspergillus nanangensis TaxID=2582783 RepID=A0AAD4GSR8_ASPNN|nr:hypothetical protein FE257_009521 [Aspergillus nanangensis]
MLATHAILWPFLLVLSMRETAGATAINRQHVVRRYNPVRTNLSTTTPMQVGNGNFAFGADITGLQSLLPFNILSSWCWCNDSLPTIPGQTDPSDFTGLDWWTHGRLVNYDQPNPAEAAISQWMIANPHRVNLGRVGFLYKGRHLRVDDVTDMVQRLDLYSGILASEFTLHGHAVSVKTAADPSSDVVGVDVRSSLLLDGSLSVFWDYPLTTGLNKFEAPFVGNWNASSAHSTLVTENRPRKAVVKHSLGGTAYYTTITWEKSAHMTGPDKGTHKYHLQPTGRTSRFAFNMEFSPRRAAAKHTFATVEKASTDWWAQYWESGAFVDLTETGDSDAEELQRRIILSQYLLAVNSAGKDPPQESGLQNNGWYGKFHLEMVFWHLGHWARWNKWDILDRSLGVYERFLPSSMQRAQHQGYAGARLGKMSDPSGRSAPGEINSLLIWQQPHPMYFAELEYRAFPTQQTLQKWDRVLDELAAWMVSYAWWNASTQVYDLGPPLHPSSENTNPNTTYNPTFELAYWRFGLTVASEWKTRQAIAVPKPWTQVLENLAPLPVVDGAYAICAGLPDMWNTSSYTSDHPSQIAVFGLLPPTAGVDVSVVNVTMDRIAQTWDLAKSYGWDFPMLAMTSLRLGDPNQAVAYLLDAHFQFDDVGNPVGTVVPTPYFPASSSLMLAVAMMAGGWDGQEKGHFPEKWQARAEGFSPGM